MLAADKDRLIASAKQTALQLRQNVAQHMGVPLDTVALSLRGAKLADDVTTEECELFGLSKELAVLTV